MLSEINHFDTLDNIILKIIDSITIENGFNNLKNYVKDYEKIKNL